MIDSTHVPADKSNKQEMFLRVFAQQIHFDERYPVLSYQNSEIRSDDFAEKDRDFSTAYITGTDIDIGTFQMGEQKLTFLGMKDDLPNVYFLGLNLMYEAVNRKDAALTDILNDVLGISNEHLYRSRYHTQKMDYRSMLMRILIRKQASIRRLRHRIYLHLIRRFPSR